MEGGIIDNKIRIIKIIRKQNNNSVTSLSGNFDSESFVQQLSHMSTEPSRDDDRTNKYYIL